MQYDPVHLEVTNNNNDVGWCAVTETFAISEVKVKETANGGNLKNKKKKKKSDDQLLNNTFKWNHCFLKMEFLLVFPPRQSNLFCFNSIETQIKGAKRW